MFLGTTIFSFSKDIKYSRAKIWFDGKPVSELAQLGVDLLEGEYRPPIWFISDFNQKELNVIRNAGFRVDILIDDVIRYYRERSIISHPGKLASNPVNCNEATYDYPTPSHFYLGSMGGFFTYNQLLEVLDSMRTLYPGLITIRQAIDVTPTIEGRPIYYVKISDNPDVNETEPEVLYTAVHHAREPESMSQLIYYMWYLLENYSADSTVRNLVNTTEMYFVPCVNPDGYIYNESTNPLGGGMWRKNRRDNLDGEFGVDLNRNYGEQWGLDNIGSSPLTSDGTYRGASGFSEPETQAMKNFTNNHEFKLALNYHTYGNFHIVPWGYGTNFYTPDSTQFDFYAQSLTKYNHFLVGTPNQTVNYTVNGNSDDWMYGDQTLRDKIFAMTPEVGESSDGFWPAANRIVDLCKGSMYSNITLARLAGVYGTIHHSEEHYITSLNSEFYFNFQREGLDTSGSISVSLIPLSANILSVGNPAVFSGLSLLQIVPDSIAITLNSSTSPGDEVRFVVAVDNGLFLETDTVSRIYGSPVAVLSDDASDLSMWNTSTTNWDVTTEDFVSPNTSITDSPFNTYASSSSSPLTLLNPVSLTGALDAMLSFDTKWSIEAGYDYAQVLVSSDNGMSWTALCGNYTKSGNGNQAFGEPLYDGTQSTWVHEQMSLNDFLGQDILIRFQIVSDQFQEQDGFYFDNLRVDLIANSTFVNQHENVKAGLSFAVPNPASGDATVSYQSVMPGATFTVYNAFGEKVMETRLNDASGKIQIPSSGFANGMYSYFILQKDGSVSEVMKLLVQK